MAYYTSIIHYRNNCLCRVPQVEDQWFTATLSIPDNCLLNHCSVKAETTWLCWAEHTWNVWLTLAVCLVFFLAVWQFYNHFIQTVKSIDIKVKRSPSEHIKSFGPKIPSMPLHKRRKKKYLHKARSQQDNTNRNPSVHENIQCFSVPCIHTVFVDFWHTNNRTILTHTFIASLKCCQSLV